MKNLCKTSMIQLNVIIKATLFSASLMMLSCDTFVEVDLPKSQLTREAVFSDYSTANAAMADIYSKMRDTGLISGGLNGLTVQMGNYADELDFYGSPSSPTVSFYSNTVLPTNSNIALFWNNSFNQIYGSNAILEGVENSNFTIAQKAKLKGEALFIRALLHFYLMQIFGDIPYITSTDYTINRNVSKIKESEIYENITADLKNAEILLPASYDSQERVRVNSFAAKSILSRIYLYRGMWDSAVTKASEVIANNTLYKLETNINKVFLKSSSEAIWQLMPSLTGKNTDEAIVFTFTTSPPPLTALNPDLIDSFDNNDLRKTGWISKISTVSGTSYYASKYKESKPTTNSVEFSIVLRLSEQYLIRSEALAHLSELDGAREDLNTIRKRAGITEIISTSKEELLRQILEERKKELFTEYGHRFFDLKRTGKLDFILGKKQGWNSTDEVLPIPEAEIASNPNLKPQNPGY